MAGGDQSWLRRFRSSSFSSEVDIDDSNGFNSKSGKESRDHWRSSTGSCSSLSPEEYTAAIVAGREKLQQQSDYFPYSCLTNDCKLHIFAQLSPAERGNAAKVCHEWAILMRNPSMWNNIDLAEFPPFQSSDDDVFSSEDGVKLYEAYRARVKRFVAYLVNVRPIVKSLKFEFDIGDVRDGWLEMLHALFRASVLNELLTAELVWTDTPCKPYVPDNSSATWCANDCKDLMYRHRHRQRLFVKFFDLFTAVAVNLESLSIPFDWTERSLHALRRLTSLKVLNLQKYFVFQPIDQTVIDSLFGCVPMVSSLTMEIWTPSGRGLQAFQLNSENLEFLDVSRCRGFYIEEMNLPKLKELHVSLCPMNGPLVSGEGIDVVCVYDVIKNGAANLRQLNELTLQDTWHDEVHPDLDALLKSVCACAKHQTDTSD